MLQLGDVETVGALAIQCQLTLGLGGFLLLWVGSGRQELFINF